MASSVRPLREPVAVMTSGYLDRFIPEPQSSLKVGIKRMFESFLPGIGDGIGTLTELAPGLQGLIDKQVKIQQQMQLVTLYSNIEKSKHESRMAAIRNVRTA